MVVWGSQLSVSSSTSKPTGGCVSPSVSTTSVSVPPTMVKIESVRLTSSASSHETCSGRLIRKKV